jgi:hypothetical protein
MTSLSQCNRSATDLTQQPVVAALGALRHHRHVLYIMCDAVANRNASTRMKSNIGDFTPSIIDTNLALHELQSLDDRPASNTTIKTQSLETKSDAACLAESNTY